MPACLAIASCAATDPAPTVSYIELPVEFNTPDGMDLDAWGNIILSCPNYNEPLYPARILRIDADDRVSVVAELPLDPRSGRAGPLGVAVGGTQS